MTEPSKQLSLFSELFRNELKQIIREVITESGSTAPKPALLTAEQLAEALQVNKATIYERVKRNDIPHYTVGRFLRFNLQEVLENDRKKNKNPS